MRFHFHEAFPRGWGMWIRTTVLCILLFSIEASAQTMRVVILGSSTADGTGPVNPANAWARRYQSYLSTSGITTEVINLAYGGYTTFAILPTGYVSPYRSKWNLPVDPNRNITKALSLNPTHIIINFPSNDQAMGVPAAYELNHYDIIVAEARARNIPVWITTTQPRNDTQTVRTLLMEMRDSTFSHFGQYAVDFWNGIANADGTIRPEYNVDGIHLNDAAHAILFERVKAKVPATVVLAAPTISRNPANQTVRAGQDMTMSVEAAGSLPLTYQWQKNSADIPGATTSIYSIPVTSKADSGAQFRCVVSNSFGRATSTSALLTVLPPLPIILNGGFEADVTAWTFFSNASGSFSTISPGFVGSRAAKLQITTAGSNVQLYQANVPLDANSQYTLQFAAYSTSGHDFAVYLHQHDSPWTNYGIDSWVVDLQKGWNHYSLTFITKGFTGRVTNARLRFALSPYNTDGDVYGIDSVALVKVSGQVTSSDVTAQQLAPAQFELRDNYPNPFNPTTSIQYILPEHAAVTLRVYSAIGELITTLVSGAQDRGTYTLTWDGRNASGTPVASGIYMCRFTATGRSGSTFISTKRMGLVK